MALSAAQLASLEKQLGESVAKDLEDLINDGLVVDTADITAGAVDAAALGALAVETAKINTGAVTTAKLATDAVTTAKVTNGNITIAKLQQGIGQIVDLGAPDTSDDNRFLESVVMQATAYTLDNTTLPADNPPRNIIVTHTTDTTTDTLGDMVVAGTDVDGTAINETITIAADGVATGTKCFATVTSATSASWVQGGGVSDLIEIGYGTKLGLPRVVTSTSYIFCCTADSDPVAMTAKTAHATLVEECGVDCDTAATYDSTKEILCLIATE